MKRQDEELGKLHALIDKYDTKIQTIEEQLIRENQSRAEAAEQARREKLEAARREQQRNIVLAGLFSSRGNELAETHTKKSALNNKQQNTQPANKEKPAQKLG